MTKDDETYLPLKLDNPFMFRTARWRWSPSAEFLPPFREPDRRYALQGNTELRRMRLRSTTLPVLLQCPLRGLRDLQFLSKVSVQDTEAMRAPLHWQNAKHEAWGTFRLGYQPGQVGLASRQTRAGAVAASLITVLNWFLGVLGLALLFPLRLLPFSWIPLNQGGTNQLKQLKFNS